MNVRFPCKRFAALLTCGLLLAGCSLPGERQPEGDQYCHKPERPEAYRAVESGDNEKLRRKDCDEVFVHIGRKDPVTGKFQDDGEVYYCCAAR